MDDYKDLIELGLHGDGPLKVILKGFVEGGDGVVAVVFATLDEHKAKAEIERLNDTDTTSYYMVYSVPLDTDLTTIGHYPSIAISKEDLA